MVIKTPGQLARLLDGEMGNKSSCARLSRHPYWTLFASLHSPDARRHAGSFSRNRLIHLVNTREIMRANK